MGGLWQEEETRISRRRAGRVTARLRRPAALVPTLVGARVAKKVTTKVAPVTRSVRCEGLADSRGCTYSHSSCGVVLLVAVIWPWQWRYGSKGEDDDAVTARAGEDVNTRGQVDGCH